MPAADGGITAAMEIFLSGDDAHLSKEEKRLCFSAIVHLYKNKTLIPGHSVKLSLALAKKRDEMMGRNAFEEPPTLDDSTISKMHKLSKAGTVQTEIKHEHILVIREFINDIPGAREKLLNFQPAADAEPKVGITDPSASGRKDVGDLFKMLQGVWQLFLFADGIEADDTETVRASAWTFSVAPGATQLSVRVLANSTKWVGHGHHIGDYLCVWVEGTKKPEAAAFMFFASTYEKRELMGISLARARRDFRPQHTYPLSAGKCILSRHESASDKFQRLPKDASEGDIERVLRKAVGRYKIARKGVHKAIELIPIDKKNRAIRSGRPLEFPRTLQILLGAAEQGDPMTIYMPGDLTYLENKHRKPRPRIARGRTPSTGPQRSAAARKTKNAKKR
jgi:hypothetical protein